MVELDWVSRIPGLIWELIEVICSIGGFDFMELQEQLFENDQIMAIFSRMLPERSRVLGIRQGNPLKTER